jgi:hypothetical protein
MAFNNSVSTDIHHEISTIIDPSKQYIKNHMSFIKN